jgi:hypothetical protein
MKRVITLLIGFLVINSSFVLAQQDSIIFKNGDDVVGEIKSMENSIIVVKTNYSDSDFKIKWRRVKEIYTARIFLVSLSDGRFFHGKLSSISDVRIMIMLEDDSAIECDLEDIVYLNQVKQKFINKLTASIDLGFTLAKANDLRQFSSGTHLGYRADDWYLDMKFSSIFSRQDETESIRRNEGSINYRYLMPRNWYSLATISLLSNTEQKLDFRMNAQLGMGHFLVRTNSIYWGVKLGFNRNVERYSNETGDRESWEGYFGTEANFFNTGDFSMSTNIMAYPSITKKGRWRTDWNLDIKYDLPLDFYINVGGSMNFDNFPAEDAGKTDYVLRTGIGWEL